MKLKVHRPNSCLSWFLWVLGALVVLVLLHNGYAQMRIFLARTQAEGLARELGYTPESFLSEKLNQSNVNIITGSYSCYTEFFFVTRLDMSEFEDRLQKAKRRSLRIDPFPGDRIDVYLHLPLAIVGDDDNKVTSSDAFPPIPTFSWSLPVELLTGRGFAYLYHIESVPSLLMYGERPINGNIAVIRRNAGRFPLWVLWC